MLHSDIMKNIVSKRIRITKNGKMVRRKMGGGHNGSTKTNKQKISLRQSHAVSPRDHKGIIAELLK